MRIFSFRKIRRLFSFASMGINRRGGRGVRRRHNAFQQRRDAFSSWRLNSEQLEPKKLLSVNEVIPPADGTYIENDVISIRVNFTDPVVVTDSDLDVATTPFIKLTIGSEEKEAVFSGGSGTDSLFFNYTVGATDEDLDGIEILSPIQLDGEEIQDAVTFTPITGTDLDISDPITGVGVIPLENILVGTPTEPTVTVTNGGGVTSVQGDIIEFTATYPRAVTVDTAGGTPFIDIDVDGNVRPANYVSGSGSNTLRFQYPIVAGEEDTNGIQITAPVIDRNGGTMTDATGDVLLTFAAPDTTAVLVDAVQPTVLSAAPPAPGNYSDTANSNLDITFVMSDAVTVDETGGTPTIPLTIGGQVRNADYVSGSGTSTLVFRYTIASPTDVFANGTFDVGDIALAGGTIEDAAGNEADLTGYVAPTPTGVLINRTGPIITVTDGDGETSVAGDIIELTATFPLAVTVGGVSTPFIGINIDGNVRPANYVSGSGSNTLRFQYPIVAGEEDTNGITIPAPAIDLDGGATITDTTGDVLLTFAAPAPDTTAVLVDAVQPTVLSAAPPAPGNYSDTANSNLDITFVMSDAVTVDETGGTPTIPLTIGGQVRNADYVSGSGTSTLVFRYTIASPTDVFANGTFDVGDIALAGGTIEDAAGNDADLTGYVAPTPTGVLINRTEPTVTVTDGDPATSVAGDIIEFTATYAHAVTVDTNGGTTIPSIAINVDGTLRQADYVSGSSSTALVFQYEVQDGEEDTNGITIPGPIIVLNGGTITDTTGDVLLTFVGPDTSAVLVDAVAPTVVGSPTGPIAGSYSDTANSNLDITVVMSDAVTVDETGGTPTIPLTIGGQVRTADYVSGSGTTTLVFRYTIASPTDVYANGTFDVGDINLAGGTIQDAEGNDADLTGYVAPTPTGVLINRPEPTVAVTTPAVPGTSAAGDIIEFTATYAQAVTVNTTGGTPSITIDVGGTTRQADYVSGSGSTDLVFQYVIQDGEEDTNGITITAPTIDLDGGATMTDVNGDVVLSFVMPSTAGVLVDAVAPTVVGSPTGPIAGSYSDTANSNLDITVVMSEAVTVDTTAGTPIIELDINGRSRQAEYNAGASTSTTLVFRYTIASSTDVFANDTFTVGAIDLAGGTIQDAEGNDADLTGYVAPTPTGVLINRTEPTVAVTTPAGPGTSVAEGIIEFTATYLHDVFVDSTGGTPQIAINVGGTVRQADYAAGSGSETLQFRYVVQSTDEDTNGITIPLESISLNGGTINDVAGDPALLTFTAPDTSAVLVDGIAPTVVSTFGPAAGSYSNAAGDDLTITVVMDDAVTVDTTAGTPIIELDINGRSRQAEYNAGASTSTTLVFRYTIASPTDVFANGTFTVGNISTAGGTIQDAIGNDADLTGYIAPTPANVLINRVEPTVTITDGDSDTSAAGEIIELTATYPQAVTVTGTPQIGINIGGTVRQATFSGGNNTTALRFQYEIVDGEEDTNGITIPGPAIELNAGTMTDPTGDVVLSFIAPDTSAAEVDAVAPTALSIEPSAPGSYGNGDNLDITVVTSEAVTVDTTDGIPRIVLTIGGQVRNAEYDAVASNSTTLVFRYTIASSTDVFANGTFIVADAINLNDGRIRDAVGNDYEPTGLAAPTPTGVLINRTEPTVTVTDGDGDTSVEGEIIEFTVDFPHSVTVTGTPQIGINVGGTPQQADYAAGSGSETLQFRYVVQSTDEDTNGITIPLESISLNGGTINDVAGDPALLTFTAPDTSAVLVDGIAPTVVSTFGPAAGSYSNAAGDDLTITVVMDDAVTVDTTAGTPTIPLTIGGQSVDADYDSGTGTTTLVFSYTIEADIFANGTFTVGNISTAGGTIQDATGNDADLTGFALNPTGILINRTEPTVTVTDGDGDTSVEGEIIEFTVDFPHSVTVTGTPQIGINVGGTVRQADYAAGSGSETLQFRYVVQSTDEDTNGITIPLESISLNGGTINDVAGDPALLTFTAPDTSAVLVDGIAPTVVSTFGPAAGSYSNAAGDDLTITVVMDDAVTVDTTAGTPIIELDINGRSRQAEYNAGASTSTTLVFRYTIASPTDVFANGTFTVGNISTAGGTIQDAIGNDADLTGYIAPTPANVLINRVEPTVTITDGDSDTSAAGEIIELTATYPQAVTVTGTPQIGINIGGTVRQATFSGGNNTTALRFQYEIVDGEEDTNGITIPGPAIELNAGTMTDPTGDVVLSFIAPDTSAAEVDAVAPTVISASGPTAGSYGNGDDLGITVVMSEDVTVDTTDGTPIIPLDINGSIRNAEYDAVASNSTTLVFRYTIASSTDVYANGTIGVGNIILAGGTIRDAVTNEADLTGYVAPTPTGVLINRTEPTVTVTDGDNTTNSAGDIIEFTVVFPHSVTVTGTPQIGINVGGTPQQADYAAGSGSETLQFRYVVQATDEDTNGITIPLESISLNGGTINDVAGDPALLTFTAPDTSNIDTVTAVLQGITVSDGTYAGGDTISLTATFDSVVTVTGTPRIALNLDQGGVVFADYANTGSGTTALVFEYQVQTDDLDLTGITINDPILPNGGTILGFGGNDAVLTFTAPATDNVLVDAVGPVAVDVAPPTAGSYVTGQVLSFAVDFDDNVEVAGTPLLPINIGGTLHNAEYVGGAGTSTLTFEHIILPTDQDGDGIVVDPANITGTITDAVGNAADFTTVNIPSTANVLVNTAVITTISASPNDLYVAGDTIRLTVIFSQPVNVDDVGGTSTPGIALTVGSNAAIFADYVSGTGTTTLVFEYEVQTGDVDTDGILVADRITLNGGEINDLGGAPAVLNFTSPDTAGILVDAEGPDAPTLITPAADNYLTGDTLTFNLVFAEPVQVTGSPRIPLEIGTNSPGGTPTERFAILSAGAGTDTLTFEYVIQPTDHDIDGLQINSPVDGLITDAFGNGADLTIPSLTDAGIRINPTKILSLGVSANGDYITGQHIDFTATFSEPVTVAGTPTIELTIGNTTISAVFQSGNGTDELTFRYVVNVNDTDEDGITLVTNTVDLGDPVDSSIVAVSDGGQAILTFTPPETSGITVNAVPRITAVATTTPDGAYDIDDIIDIQVTTSLPVKVTDAANAKLELNTGVAGTDFATFIGSANVFTNTLVFQYVVQDGDYTADLDYLAIDSLTLAAVSQAGNTLVPMLEAPGSTNSIAFNHDVAISTVQPVVETITTMTPDGAYSVGDNIIIDATLSVPGPAGQTFIFQLNSTGIVVLTTDGLGGAQGVYTVLPGHNTDSLKVLAIDPNNTTDAGNNPLSSALPSNVTVGNISIDTEAPVIMEFGVSAIVDRDGTSVNVDPLGTSGTFGVNAEFSIFAIASEDLREGSSITVTLNNGETVLLSAPTNTSSDTLSGTYLVKPSDLSIQDLTIDSFVPAVAMDLAGTDLVDTTVPEHPSNIGDVHDLHIDTMPPNVTAFSATSGFFKAGLVITINANLSEPISDNSNFTVTLSNNEDVVMNVLAGQDTATGNYTVQPGDNEDPLTILTIHSVTDVEDALENPLQTDLPTGFNLGDTSAVVLDTTDPTVVSITSDQLTLNGTQTATLTITLSEQSDDFDETDLTFNNATISNFTDLGGGDVYTVELTPEADFEGPITASVSNSSFTDLADNSFDTTTENATIDVDTKATTIVITSDDNALSIGEIANLTFTLSETVTDFDASDISVTNGTISILTLNTSDPSGLTYLAVFTPANTFEGDAVVSVAADSIQDAFLNPNEESTLTLAVDTVAPTVTSFSATSGSYKENDPVTINANLSEAMSGPSSFDITLSNNQVVTMDILDGETTAVGIYTVQAGDNENPLTVLAIGAGTATDEATNPLVTTIPGGSNLGDTSTVILDTIAPSAVITASPVAVNIGESSTVTITLSEDSNDIDLSKINITNGTASDFQPTIPNSQYQFTFTPTAGFEGVATISINAGAFTDVAGNPSAALATATITVDTTAPAAPTIALASGITLPISNIEAINGFLQIFGEGGATIEATLRNTSTNANLILPVGTGSLALTVLHIIQLGNEGSIEVTARQTDAAGNIGPDSAPFSFHLDTVIAAPTLAIRNNVTDPLTLAEITDASGVLNVQGELDADITVTFAGNNGGFSLPYTGTGFNQPIILTQADVDTLGEGAITVTATQTDDAGNPSAAASLNLIFDQTAPEVDSLYLDVSSGSYGPGVSIPVVGTLSEPAVKDQILNVILNVLDVDGVTPVVVPVTVQANGTAIEGTYIVQVGHNTDDLTIDGHTNDHPSGPVTDLAGNELLDSSSNNSSNLKTLGGGSAGVLSSGIIIDTIPPEITEWLPTADTYYDGDDVPIQVRISEPAMPGTTISVRPNTLGTNRDAIELERDDNDPTLFTGMYTVALGESTQGADLIVTVDPSTTLTDLAGNVLVIPSPATQTGVIIDGSITLAAEMEWGPNPGNGHSHVLIELSTGITGMNIGAFTLEHNGRTISLRDASLVATDSSNYILVLPPRIASMSGDGTFIIAIFSEDIRAEDDDTVGIDNPLEDDLELPDPGMNTNNQGFSR